MRVATDQPKRSPLRRGWDVFVWYVKGVMGEHAYEQYLRYHRATGCTAPPMTEKQYWRDRQDRQDGEPQSRCC